MRFRLLMKAEMNCLPYAKKIFKLSQSSQLRENSAHILQRLLHNSFPEGMSSLNNLRTWHKLESWLMDGNVTLSHLKRDGKYFIPCSVELQVSGTISEIFLTFSKKLTLVLIFHNTQTWSNYSTAHREHPNFQGQKHHLIISRMLHSVPSFGPIFLVCQSKALIDWGA